ncbi:MAG TPA: hypothetical protein VFK47_02975, partial [Ktedonobacteraceae bacterium]|nr:hypothetical protein [Ktedonobacteraceae bacterium]
DGMAMLVERHGRDAAQAQGILMNVPGIKSGIGGQMDGELLERHDGLLGERAILRHIVGIEGLGVFSQDDIAVVRGGGSGDAGAIAPEVFFFHFRGAISLLLIVAAFDAHFAVWVACGLLVFTEAITQSHARIVLFDPGVDMLDIKGDDFPQAGDLVLESANRGVQEGLQQGRITGAQFLAQPPVTRKGVVAVKAVRGAGIQCKLKAQFDDEQGMLEEEAAQVTGVDQAFADADEEGFEVGTFGMSRSSASRALLLALLDEGPIQQGKEGAVVLDQRVMLKQSSHRRLVKEVRCRYHNVGLLLGE